MDSLANPDAIPPPRRNRSVPNTGHTETWLVRSGGSIALTTYPANKAFFLGLERGGRLVVHDGPFAHCMGLGGNADVRLYFCRRA